MQHSSDRKAGSFFVRTSAWAVLVWERLWPLLVPVFMVACAFLAFSWVGGWRYLQSLDQPLWLWLGRGAFAISAIWAVSFTRHFQLPARSTLVRRIETASDLENRPITAQNDALAMGEDDAFGRALWETHQRRMAEKLDNLTAGTPAPKANRFDPFAVRAMLPIVAFAAFFFSFSPDGGRIGDVVEVRNAVSAVPVRIDAWINPPAYTRKPPIYLTLDAASEVPKGVSAPIGSEFFLRFVGTGDVEVERESANAVGPVAPEETEEGSPDREFKFAVEEDTVIRLSRDGNEMAQWGVSVVEDKAPKIGFFENPSSALSGSLQLTYTLEDDYGVVDARGIINPVEQADQNARPLVEPPRLDLPLPRHRAKKGVSKLNKDLTEHPLAGSKVTIMLEAEDDRGQIGRSETREMTLPGRRFSNPLARAIVEQRRILAMDANQQVYVSNLLDAVSRGPEQEIDNAAAMISMRVAYRRLVDARSDDELRSTLDLLWEIALGIEFGDLSDAERRLRDAQERLSEALENGASDEEIERLMEELRQAMNEMMQALAEQARNAPQSQNPFEQNNSQTLTQNDLERMMDRIEELARSGAQDAARQMLSELQRMMDNLRAGRHEQQRQAEGNQLNQTLDQLSELMQRQQELMNETYRMQRQQQEQGLRPNQGQRQQGQRQQGQRQQGQRQQGQQQQGQRQQGQRGQQQQGQQQGGQDGQQPGQGGRMTPEEFAEALESLRQQQEALRQQLGELGEQLEGLGLQQPDELGQAQNEMGQAGENLGQGNPGSAATDQGEALEALRQGAQNMMQQMAGDRQQGGPQQSQNQGQGQAGQRRGTDPLGREDGNSLNAESDVEIPGEIDVQRARRILEAIRDRLAIPDNPLIEKDYLERLLRTE